jgi:hypothetical protein
VPLTSPSAGREETSVHSSSSSRAFGIAVRAGWMGNGPWAAGPRRATVGMGVSEWMQKGGASGQGARSQGRSGQDGKPALGPSSVQSWADQAAGPPVGDLVRPREQGHLISTESSEGPLGGELATRNFLENRWAINAPKGAASALQKGMVSARERGEKSRFTKLPSTRVEGEGKQWTAQSETRLAGEDARNPHPLSSIQKSHGEEQYQSR